MKKRPTIVDVARLCEVTPATVSRVLNGKPNFSARQELRDRIFSTAEKIGYMPDLAARNLNRKHTRIVGIFASPHTNLAEGITEMLLEGLVSVLEPAGYELFFKLAGQSGDGEPAEPEDEDGLAAPADRALPFWRFDGAVILQAPDPRIVDALQRRRVPFVGVNEIDARAAASVVSHDTHGVELALDHLFELGHRTVAYTNATLNYLPHYSIVERHEALVAGAKRRRMKLVEGHDSRFDFRDPAGFVRHAVREGGTAILSYDHQQAVRLLGAAYELELKIPSDLSLMCFNDLFPISILPPPLSAIRVDGRMMGEAGARSLLSVLGGNGSEAKEKIIRIDEELVARASTAPPPAK